MYQYVGKITHVDGYANNDIFVLTFLDTLQEGAKVTSILQWTRDAYGHDKANHTSFGTITNTETYDDGSKKVIIHKGENYYWYELDINETEDQITAKQWNQRNEYCGEGALQLYVKKWEETTTYDISSS